MKNELSKVVLMLEKLLDVEVIKIYNDFVLKQGGSEEYSFVYFMKDFDEYVINDLCFTMHEVLEKSFKGRFFPDEKYFRYNLKTDTFESTNCLTDFCNLEELGKYILNNEKKIIEKNKERLSNYILFYSQNIFSPLGNFVFSMQNMEEIGKLQNMEEIGKICSNDKKSKREE